MTELIHKLLSRFLPYHLWLFYDIWPTAFVVYVPDKQGNLKVFHANRHFINSTGYKLSTLQKEKIEFFLYPEEEVIKSTHEEEQKVQKIEWQQVRFYQNFWKHGITGEKISMNWQTIKRGDIYLCKPVIK